MVSERFMWAIKTAGIPAYKIAHKAKITPSKFYRITSGIDIPVPGDPSILAVAKVLGLKPEECFEEDKPDA